MKSLNNLGKRPTGIPLLADDIVEFHAARILMLIKVCGTQGRIDGLTKMAKLDFFVRYPKFFGRLVGNTPDISNSVESNMIRYYYGPWDKRYYQVLAYLEARQLLQVSRKGKTVQLILTPLGGEIARQIESKQAFELMKAHMTRVKNAFGDKKGNQLKDLIYKTFGEEITQKALSEVIE